METEPNALKLRQPTVLAVDEPANVSWEKTFLYLSWIAVVITFPFCLFFCVVWLNEYSRAIIFRLGRLRDTDILGPGLVWILPCIDRIAVIDVRTRGRLLPMQELLTKDSVTVSVDAVVFYCIHRSFGAFPSGVELYIQSVIRYLVGLVDFHDLLKSRDDFSDELTSITYDAVWDYGFHIELCDIMEIRLPEAFQRTLAQEAEAEREAMAKIISADGEKKASSALKEASDAMKQSNITLQLRELQTIRSLASDGYLTIVFPFPMDMMACFEKSESSKKAPNDNDNDNDSGSPRNSMRLFLSSLVADYLGINLTADESQDQSKNTQTDFEDDGNVNEIK